MVALSDKILILLYESLLRRILEFDNDLLQMGLLSEIKGLNCLVQQLTVNLEQTYHKLRARRLKLRFLVCSRHRLSQQLN